MDWDCGRTQIARPRTRRRGLGTEQASVWSMDGSELCPTCNAAVDVEFQWEDWKETWQRASVTTGTMNLMMVTHFISPGLSSLLPKTPTQQETSRHSNFPSLSPKAWAEALIWGSAGSRKKPPTTSPSNVMPLRSQRKSSNIDTKRWQSRFPCETFATNSQGASGRAALIGPAVRKGVRRR